ncbi:hypothetical protein FE783_02270 [Paenibacillus mesophilus]|uniref:hypothetical protein n=1 Tax=Paenibacillus mesophilus TaxID=2582849 RepID=UPI00110DCC2A|nr:hypothetical protein [Paenibacillus mesophilus]TMV53032.1 hypothetical protein FE783_02270 [Paenibacillus mesophilus]
MTFDERLDRIKSLYKEGTKGNANAVQEANQLLERLRQDYPDNPLADAYHGSIMLLIAKDRTKPLERLKWAKNGLKLLDKAVAAAPNDNRIRYLRGKSAYRLPEKHFQRTQMVIDDYNFVINHQVKLGSIDYTKLTYELGEAHRRIGRNGDAARCWTKLEQQTQDPEFKQLLRQKLQSLEGRPAVEHIQSNDSLTSLLMKRTARAAGTVILNWVKENKKKEERRERKRRKKKKRH